ncbi:hypothetical protein N7490_002128 [Penicillium lividum]|nr:hypothetical protein N7490_002128 [Penicillium lividum]
MTTTLDYLSTTTSSLTTESENAPPTSSFGSSFNASPAGSTTVTTITATTATATSKSVSFTAYLTTYTSQSTPGILSISSSTTTVAKNRTSSIQSSLQHATHSKISPGALAGAIVGAFAGGCILAFLMACFWLRDRKKSPPPSVKETSSVLDSSILPKGPKQSTKNVPNGDLQNREASIIGPTPLDLSPFVAEAADDSTVCSRVQTFFDQVGLHVDNYYSRPESHRRLMPEMVAQINEYDSSLFGTSLATLLSVCRSQRAIITHTLVHAILLAIQPKSYGASLLPACYRLGPEASGIDIWNADDDRAIFAWRMFTSYLYVKNSRTNPAQLEAQEDSITRFANSINETFALYSDPQFNEGDRLAHMTSVTRAAVNLGIWLFSQPCSFEFHWPMNTPMANQAIVLPAVVKTCDENGVRMAVPQTLLEEFTLQI